MSNLLSTYVLCVHCNQQVHRKPFPLHLKTYHNDTFENYVKNNIELFSPTWKICPICNIKPTNGTTCSKDCGRIEKSRRLKGISSWDRMRTDEIRQNAKDKISKTKTGKKTGVDIWARMNTETQINAKKKLRKSREKYRGVNSPLYGKKLPTHRIQALIKGIKMNGLEKMFADFLTKYNIDHYFQFFINSTTTHSYDFKIKGINLIIEVDGDYWHGGPGCTKHFWKSEETKKTDILKTKIANEHGYDLIRFWESDIKRDFKSIQNIVLSEINKYKK